MTALLEAPSRGVVVTGASGGIGAATVRRLVGQGATVYAGDLTSDDEIHAAVSGLDLWGVVNCGASMITGVTLPIDGGYTCR